MKVLEVGSLNIKLGGPPYSLSKQMRGLAANNVDSVCLMAPFPEEYIIEKGLSYYYTKNSWCRIAGFEYIPSLNQSIAQINCAEGISIMHIQEIWTYLSLKSASVARNLKIPYVITPRGSLYREALKCKTLKKKLAWWCYEHGDLNKAACIQATCLEEMEEIRCLGCKSPIAVIPNSHDVSAVAKGTYRIGNEFVIGYIGRLSPRKHVERLIYAVAELISKFNNIKLWIIGSDDPRYEEFLKEECKRLKLEDKVSFTGFLRGDKKDKAIRKCNIFAFPSNFENWGNVVPEVLAREVPVIASTGMPWQILQEEQCGWWVNNDLNSITKALSEACSTDLTTLKSMGIKGRKLVEEKFSVEMIGSQLKELYTWILYGGEKPSFVYL